MQFISERFWFEPRGPDYVFRATAFSRGYVLTAEEKTPLLAALRRFHLRAFAEGLGLIVLAALIAGFGPFDPEVAPARFAVAALVAIVVYAPISIVRQRRLVARCLAGKSPTLDRLRFREAVTRPRPMVKKRVALKLIRYARIVFVLAVLGVDGLVLRAVVRPLAERMDDTGGLVAALAQDPDIWLLLVAVNAPFAVLYAGLVLIRRQWARLPDEP